MHLTQSHTSNSESQSSVLASVEHIRAWDPRTPDVALILGSGLGDFAETIESVQSIGFGSIPGFPLQTVSGHKGKVYIGRIHGKTVLALQGRIHFYECGDLDRVLHPIRVLAALGIRRVILTNAAGGLNRQFTPGSLMLITDQIDLTFVGLTGERAESRHTPYYDPSFGEIALDAARNLGLLLNSGVYAGMLGPTYETASEVEMAYRLGADAVGMSTVKESAEATRLGMSVLGISCITNPGTGIGQERLDHDDVREVGRRVTNDFTRLLNNVIAAM
jgi:purine-nucleoside phosphorylase